MDLITQGLLGGVLAQTASKKEDIKLATIIGIIAGLLADADIFIYSSNDPLLNIEFHRHFTHSLFFIPFGAAIAALLLWPFFKNQLSIKRLYLYSFMGYSMSGILDACTSYGTHLFWPFSDERVSFNIISIVDPVFTLLLLITLLVTIRRKYKKVAQLGLMIAAFYMLIGFIQLQRAENLVEELIAKRGHTTTKHLVKPTIANLLLWRSLYIYKDRIYVDAVRVGMFSQNRVFEGDSVEKFNMAQALPGLKSDSILANDIKRFTKFSDDYVAIDSSQTTILGDIRYSMLPTSVKPLWGIMLDKNKEQTHADYKFFRDTDTQSRKKFMNMLFLNDDDE